MNYDFYADVSDCLKVLRFIFEGTDLRVYDLASPCGLKIAEYRSLDDIFIRFHPVDENLNSMLFQLWSPRHDGRPIFRRVSLDPQRCAGFTFRYSTEGWGLIQLYFGGIRKKGLSPSHMGHFNEKGALKRQGYSDDLGRVNEWNWSEIQKSSRKLKYQIHNKMAVRKIGSWGVLPGAQKLLDKGIERRNAM
jgi:hypothetical protein